MYELAKTIDPTVTNDQASYFPVVSETYLGQRQTAQFQSSGQTGYIWGSAYQDALDANSKPIKSAARIPNTTGANVTIDGVAMKIANNANAEMPRSYMSIGSGGSYNYYAITAEEFKYSLYNWPNDSICPKGWKLASSFGTAKSYAALISSYGDAASSETAAMIRKVPVSFILWGRYGIDYEIGAYAVNRPVKELRFYRSEIHIDFSHVPDEGFAVRCVKD